MVTGTGALPILARLRRRVAGSGPAAVIGVARVMTRRGPPRAGCRDSRWA